MSRSHGCEGAAQRQDVGMSRSHGCEGGIRKYRILSQIDDRQQMGLFDVLGRSSTLDRDQV